MILKELSYVFKIYEEGIKTFTATPNKNGKVEFSITLPAKTSKKHIQLVKYIHENCLIRLYNKNIGVSLTPMEYKDELEQIYIEFKSEFNDEVKKLVYKKIKKNNKMLKQ